MIISYWHLIRTVEGLKMKAIVKDDQARVNLATQVPCQWDRRKTDWQTNFNNRCLTCIFIFSICCYSSNWHAACSIYYVGSVGTFSPSFINFQVQNGTNRLLFKRVAQDNKIILICLNNIPCIQNHTFILLSTLDGSETDFYFIK